MKNNLLLGITGSIAASKTEKLYNLLKINTILNLFQLLKDLNI